MTSNTTFSKIVMQANKNLNRLNVRCSVSVEIEIDIGWGAEYLIWRRSPEFDHSVDSIDGALFAIRGDDIFEAI